ncbi:MAG: O-antigen ligase family protein [Alphaproteobacteria bacterium]|nr:O-antigen ligase family protein [Alphaproteobacteria bacterium]MCB9974715.1 O-antigen ligase family protein [Rhodospirillales bacterium]
MPSERTQALIKRSTSVFVGLNVFFLLATFRHRDYTDTAMDFQILIKLSLWMAGLGLGILFFRRWIGNALRADNILLVVLLVQILLACLYAPHMTYAVACFISLVAVFMILYFASIFLDEGEILYAVLIAISVICVISIIAYFVTPEFARMGEWIDGQHVPGNRLSGVTGNPNSMGLMAAFALIIATHYRTDFARKNLPVFGICVFLNIVALLMSNSRSSLAAMIVSLSAAYFLKFTPQRILAASVLAACGIAFLLLVDLEAIMALLSRSGDAREITTATGRTYIWETAIQLIEERPFTGWGYTSTKEILPLHAYEIGHPPQSTHNLYLQMLFAMGIPGLTTFLALMFVKFYFSMKFQDFFKITIMIFLLLHGFTESTIFVGMAGSTTIMFGLAYCLEYRKKNLESKV